jgi:DDE domain
MSTPRCESHVDEPRWFGEHSRCAVLTECSSLWQRPRLADAVLMVPVAVHQWVQRITALLADAAVFIDETDVKVNGVWRYVYRAVDQDGQAFEVLVLRRRNAQAARRLLHSCVNRSSTDSGRIGR